MRAHDITTADRSLAERAGGFVAGDRVYLKGARFGAPGPIMGFERGKMIVRWADLNFVSRHRLSTLTLACQNGNTN